jgi:hypothetical protein
MRDSRLKRWLHILAGMACTAASLACAVTVWQERETIKGFRADATVKDVGVLKQQEEKDVVFRLLNVTDAPVEIVRVSTSCTCTRADTAARNLQPGESTELTARLRVGSLRGKVSASVDVLYRVGEEPTLERLPLMITATVEPHYVVAPEEVVFNRGGDGGKDSTREANITIAPNSKPVRVLKAYSTHPAIQVETITPDTATGKSTIHLVFDPSRCIAPSVKAEIIVQTDSKMEPIYRVPVRVISKQ